jgi:hypothetical protein
MRSPPTGSDGITTSHDPMVEAIRFADASWQVTVLAATKHLAKRGCLLSNHLSPRESLQCQRA